MLINTGKYVKILEKSGMLSRDIYYPYWAACFKTQPLTVEIVFEQQAYREITFDWIIFNS